MLIRAKKLPPPGPMRPNRPTTAARGYGTAHRKQRARLLRERPLCEHCRQEWATDLHHIDRDPHNHTDTNALMLCERCHHAVAHGR